VTGEDSLHTGPVEDLFRYQVLDAVETFSGGQGMVYRARTADGADVSLKQFDRATPEDVDKLLERGRMLATLDHPGLARHLETFVGPGLFRAGPPDPADCTVLYTAARWVDGQALPVSAVTVDDAFRRTVEVADAIDYLHGRGMVHRDLHPDNVIVTPAGRPTVIDLGLARPESTTGSAGVWGTPGYVPPERLAVDSPSPAGAAADRWQVATLLVHQLLGQVWGRMPAEELRQRLRTRLGDFVPDAEGAAELILTYLADEPDDRPAGPMAPRLAAIAGRGEAPGARRRHLVRLVTPIAAGLGALVLALLIGRVVGAEGTAGPRVQAPPATVDRAGTIEESPGGLDPGSTVAAPDASAPDASGDTPAGGVPPTTAAPPVAAVPTAPSGPSGSPNAPSGGQSATKGATPPPAGGNPGGCAPPAVAVPRPAGPVVDVVSTISCPPPEGYHDVLIADLEHFEGGDERRVFPRQGYEATAQTPVYRLDLSGSPLGSERKLYLVRVNSQQLAQLQRYTGYMAGGEGYLSSLPAGIVPASNVVSHIRVD
jgi:hypothetical protein